MARRSKVADDVVQGIPELVARLQDLTEAAQDVSPAWKEIGPMFAKRQDAVFDTYNGGKWLPMAPSTLKEHASPLVQTGIMREGLSLALPIWLKKHGVAFGAAKYERRVMNVAVLNTVGHRRGTKQVPPRVVVPPRRAAEKREWLKVVERHLMRAVNAD